MAFSWTVPLLACIANTLIALIVFKHGARSKLNRIVTFATVTIIFWNLNLFSLYFFASAPRALFWSTLFRTGTLLMPPTIVHTFVVFGDRSSPPTRLFLIAAYALAGALIVMNFAGLLVSDVRPHEWGYYPVARPLYGFHVLSVVVNFGFAVFLLVTNISRAPTPHRRLQAKLWLLGAGVGIVGGVTNLLPIYNIHIYPIGNLANVAYTSILSYAILRHRLIDVDLVLARAISFGVVGVLLIAPAYICVVFLQKVSFGQVNTGFSLAMLVFFLAIGVAFQTFRFWAETRVTKSLFKRKMQYRNALRLFTKRIVRIFERERLIEELGRVLEEELGARNVAVFLKQEGATAFVAAYASMGAGHEQYASDDEFIIWLGKVGRASLREEIEETEFTGRGVQVFDRNGWDVCVPIVLNTELTGFVGLGAKTSLEAYSGPDLDVLDTVAGETAIALENARLYEALRRSQEVIQRAGRLSALGTLAAGIAHEIRNPLVSVQTFFQLAPSRLGDQEFMTNFLQLTEGEVRRIADLITELLTFAKPSDRSVRAIDLCQIVEAVVRLLLPEARKRGVDIKVGTFRGPAAVSADADQMKQVLINLLLNAIEASDQGGVVEVEVRQEMTAVAKYWQVEVADQGVGIPPELRDEIFNPFFTTKSRGTGLGLAVSHQIVTEHGGYIAVESDVGVGTRFVVCLPMLARNSRLTGGEMSKSDIQRVAG